MAQATRIPNKVLEQLRMTAPDLELAVRGAIQRDIIEAGDFDKALEDISGRLSPAPSSCYLAEPGIQ